MGLDIAEFRHRHGAQIETDAVVLVIVQVTNIGGEHTGLKQQVRHAILRRKPDPPFKAESIGISGALDKAGVVAARQFFQPLEIVVLARRHRQPAVFISEKGIGQVNLVTGKIRFQLVAETARDRSRGAQPDPPRFIGKTESVVDDAVGRVDRAEVIEHAAARLEAPAVLALDLGRALEGDLDRLLLFQLFLGRGDLCLRRGNRAGRGLLRLLHIAKLRLQVGDFPLELVQLAQQRRCLFAADRLRHRGRGIEPDRCGPGQQAYCLEHMVFHNRLSVAFTLHDSERSMTAAFPFHGIFISRL